MSEANKTQKNMFMVKTLLCSCYKDKTQLPTKKSKLIPREKREKTMFFNMNLKKANIILQKHEILTEIDDDITVKNLTNFIDFKIISLLDLLVRFTIKNMLYEIGLQPALVKNH